MKRFAILAALVLCGCPHHNAVGSREVVGPDGKTMHEAFCSGSNRTFGDCMNEAARVCRGPYDIVDKTTEAAGASGSATRIGSTTVGHTTVSNSRELLFRCKEGPDAGDGLSTEALHVVAPTGDGSAGSRCNYTEDCLGFQRCLEHECR